MKHFIFCTKVFAVSTLIFLSFSTLMAQPGDSIYVLPAGTRIKVRMDTEVNSKANRVNDTFIVRIVEPVKNQGVIVVPAGAVTDSMIVPGAVSVSVKLALPVTRSSDPTETGPGAVGVLLSV